MVELTQFITIRDLRKYIGEYITYCFSESLEYLCNYLAIIGEGYIWIDPKYDYVVDKLVEELRKRITETYANVKSNDYLKFNVGFERSDYHDHITVYVIVVFYDVHNYNDFNRLYDYLLETFDDVIRESVELINNYIISNPTSNS